MSCGTWVSFRSSVSTAALMVLALGGTTLQAEHPEPSAAQLEFFEKQIRPVLIEHCYECHSQDAEELQGGLRLDFRAGVLSGGDSGPAIVPGNPDESLLIQALLHDALEMPPDYKLDDHVIDDFKQWVEMGAPDPRAGGEATEQVPRELAGRDHWAFQPVKDPPVPAVADTNWPVSDLDRFTLVRLERAGLTPARDADRYTWLRRVTFDLAGLPPSLEEIDAFLADDSPNAHETVVDRLLGSRAFGERWARYWLDLVGYADQKSSNAPIHAENAWRYRDYVIDAFNNDVPLDHFIRQQLAGDLLPYESLTERRENLVATGFLVLGDIRIADSDKEQLYVDMIDSQVDKVGKAFLGLTIGCARCHDHKFDPIPRDDYYALAGIFHSTSSIHRSRVGLWSNVNDVELPESPAEQAERMRAENEQARKLIRLYAELKSAKQRMEELSALIKASDDSKRTVPEPDQIAKDGITEVDTAVQPEHSPENLKQEKTKLTAAIVDLTHEIDHAELFISKLPLAHGVSDVSQPTDMRITIGGNPRALGVAVPRGFLQVASSGSPLIPDDQSGRMQLADWIAAPYNPLTARVAVNRIWQKLIGVGLHSNVDYFGLPEPEPSHPELLDYLATRFVDNGWSQKQLIRSIVLSRTYRMSSAHDAQAHEIDPDNRLIWRMNRSRMDAEALRDALLFASGKMQLISGGPTFPYQYPKNVLNVGRSRAVVNPPFFAIKKFMPGQEFHRSVYLPVVRGGEQVEIADLRNVFDFASPEATSGQRNVTTVPTQALFLMNSPEVKKHAQNIAARVVEEAQQQSRRLELLWLYVLNRPINDVEQREAIEFLNESSDNAWPELCHALIASNEFLMRF